MRNALSLRSFGAACALTFVANAALAQDLTITKCAHPRWDGQRHRARRRRRDGGQDLFGGRGRAGGVPSDIVQIPTRNAAAADVRDDIGILEPGKLADIVIVDGDPLETVTDLLDVVTVIKGGEIVVGKR